MAHPFLLGRFSKIKPKPPALFPKKLKPSKSRGRIHCGLDIGNFSVKVVLLREGSQEVMGVGKAPLPTNPSPEKLVLAIRNACQAAGFNGRQVNAAIGGHSVIIRYIQLPKMTREELKSSVEFEADKYIPFNVKDVWLDCQILEEREEAKRILALLVAAKKELVTHRLTLIQEAGLECAVLDVDTFAVVNAFEAASPRLPKSEVMALIDLGSEGTNINILRNQKVLFSREIPIGGARLTQAIAEKLGAQESLAETLKLRPGDRLKDLREAIGPVLENLIGELRLSFDYFESQYDKRVERLFLSGGSSRLAGLTPLLKEQFQAEVALWNPFEGISLSETVSNALKDGREEFAVAFGLALRTSDDHA